jgi:hypothetical protein
MGVVFREVEPLIGIFMWHRKSNTLYYWMEKLKLKLHWAKKVLRLVKCCYEDTTGKGTRQEIFNKKNENQSLSIALILFFISDSMVHRFSLFRLNSVCYYT